MLPLSYQKPRIRFCRFYYKNLNERNFDQIANLIKEYSLFSIENNRIKGGNIIAEGKPEEILDNKASYTAQFLKL